MPPGTPKVYTLLAIDKDQLTAQRTLKDAIDGLGPQLAEILQYPSCPQSPAHHSIRIGFGLLGIVVGVAVGALTGSLSPRHAQHGPA